MKTNSASAQTKISAEEKQVRQDLAAAYRLVVHYDWEDLIFTHISARVPGHEEHFLINPYGLMFEEITASNLVKVDLHGKIVEPTEFNVSPAGFTIHSAVYEARKDINCVVHLHTIAGTAVATQTQGLLPMNLTAMLLNNEVGYHDYEGVSLHPEEKARLVKNLGNKSTMLLKNHGTLTVGKSVGEAFLLMYYLERACAMQVATLAGGSSPIIPAKPIQDLLAKQAKSFQDEDVSLAWPAWLRMLDRKDSNYKD